MLIIKKIHNVVLGVLLAPCFASAQQGPLITVHNDEKPAYISPFDKPQASNNIEKVSSAVVPIKAAPAVQENSVVSTTTPSLTAAPTEVAARRNTTEVKKTEVARKTYRHYSRSRNRAKPTPYRELPTTDATPQNTREVVSKPAVSTAAVGVIAGTTTALTVAAITNGDVNESAHIERSERVVARAQSSAESLTQAPPSPLISSEQKPAEQMKTQATTSSVALTQQLTPVPSVSQSLPNKAIAGSDSKLFGLSTFSQMLLAGMLLVLLIMGIVIKVMVFKKDPALTDPWFKPAK